MNHDARTCPRCLEDRPCAAANRERSRWDDEGYELDKAAGLDALTERARANRASRPPRYVPLVDDFMAGGYVELDEERS